MPTININLQQEIADEISVALLKDQYYSLKSDLDEVIKTKKSVGIYSWDYKEEKKYLKKALEHFDYVIEYMAGSDWKTL